MLRVFFAFPTRLCLINFSIARICDTADNFEMRRKHKTKAKTPSNLSSELFHGFISTEVLNYAVHLNSSHSAWRVFLLLSPPLKSEFFPPKECNIKMKKKWKKVRPWVHCVFLWLFCFSISCVVTRSARAYKKSQHWFTNTHTCTYIYVLKRKKASQKLA